ncbi:MAG: hypothetical protein ACRDQA_20060 [Nocardioidaceae bacterium]
MNDLDTLVSTAIRDKADAAVPPPPDLKRITSRGRRRSRMRTGAVGVVALAVIAPLAAVAYETVPGLGRDSGSPAASPVIDGVGRLNFGGGLRLWSNQGGTSIHVGDKDIPVARVSNIGTQATGTSYGLVYFAQQRPYLLERSGNSVPLSAKPTADEHSRPHAEVDAQRPLMATSTFHDGAVRLRLYNLQQRRAVDSFQVPCSSDADCSAAKVVAVDQGLVFVRTEAGSYVWDHTRPGDSAWTQVTGPKSKVVAVRNKTILHTGPKPAHPPVGSGSPIDRSWSYTKGAIDAQLSTNGKWVLSWSNTLKPTSGHGAAIRLDLPDDYINATFDTDGSVLAVVAGGHGGYPVYDCMIPSGRCVQVSQTKTGGEPVLVGNDM